MFQHPTAVAAIFHQALWYVETKKEFKKTYNPGPFLGIYGFHPHFPWLLPQGVGLEPKKVLKGAFVLFRAGRAG
jgi:hypothetical protein